MALTAGIESGGVALTAAFDVLLLALGRVIVKKGRRLVVGWKEAEFRHVTFPALGHGVTCRLVTGEAIRHEWIVLAAAQVRLLEAAMTSGTGLL